MLITCCFQCARCFPTLAGGIFCEDPQLKEVQSWGRKEPQAFMSIMVGTVPAPEQESLAGWGVGMQ